MPRPWERRRVVYRRPLGAPPARNEGETAEAYAERRDAEVRRQIEAHREAYDRGRHDERKNRKRHPILGFFLVVLALLALIFVVLAAVQGSFTEAGRTVDRTVVRAADASQEAAGEAIDRGEAALQDTGDELQNDGPATQEPQAAPPAQQPTPTPAEQP